MIGAANDVANAHIYIVGDHAQMICGNAVGAQQYEIFQFGVGKLNATENGILESCAAGLGDGKANGCGFSRGAPPGAFLARNLSAGALVTRRAAFGGSSRATLLELSFGAKTIVSVSGGQQFGRALAIHFQPLSLMVRTLVPVEAEPAHALQNPLDHLGRRALEVGVFNAQDKRAAVMTSEQPVKQRGTGAAYVQIACGRGCEADAWACGRRRGRARRGGHYERSCSDGTG